MVRLFCYVQRQAGDPNAKKKCLFTGYPQLWVNSLTVYVVRINRQSQKGTNLTQGGITQKVEIECLWNRMKLSEAAETRERRAAM
ncbi:MAG: hypothetical protein ACRDC4_05045, partial [Plesiomonas sp.]